MKPWVKKVLYSIAGTVGVGLLGVGAFVFTQTRAFDASVTKIYAIPVPQLSASNDPVALLRGEHLARSLGGCALADCHGAQLKGGRLVPLGPLGSVQGPNITNGGMGAVYSDGDLMRLIEHGVKKDGKTVLFMTAHEINWLPQTDIVAIISYLRSLPGSTDSSGSVQVGLLGKVLDRQDKVVWDVARRIDHDHLDKGPAPEPKAVYGKYIAKLCMGCHGETYGGGPIPGAPPDFPTPTNLTPHKTGLKGWTYEQFENLADHGIRHDGQKVDPFMPVEALANMDEIERRALFAFLTTLPEREFGSR
jgi:mono/diheme cytochrome c family protein